MQANASQLFDSQDRRGKGGRENTAKITLEPLDRGFGHTLGSALRRVHSVFDTGLCGDRGGNREGFCTNTPP